MRRFQASQFIELLAEVSHLFFLVVFVLFLAARVLLFSENRANCAIRSKVCHPKRSAPIQSVDPFTGVIVMGFGTPPGGNRSYRATVYITDPALDARSLNVALQSRNGAVPIETQRAVEDAILSRARQLRIGDGAL